MSEAVIVAFITAGGGVLAVILKMVTQLLKENRRDHGIVVNKLNELTEGHTEISSDLREVKSDLRDVKADHRHLAAKVDTMAASRFWRRSSR
jgi:hypothetical protein